MRNKSGKIALLCGFISALVGYSFWSFLWEDAFYHFISLGFVGYTYAIYIECETVLWKKISFIPFVASVNALTDEILCKGCNFNDSEYISIIVITIYLCCGEKLVKKFRNFKRKNT